MRRTTRSDQRFDTWFLNAPLWRAALAFYVLTLVVIYVGLWAQTLTSGQHFVDSIDTAPGNLLGAAAATAIVLMGRHIKRRRLGLAPPRRRRTDHGSE